MTSCPLLVLLQRRTRVVMVNGHPVTVRYNDTCHFYQPPRAHHCSVNDNCIERFDHHCPWVGTTIGVVRFPTHAARAQTSFLLHASGCLTVRT
jgi:palmitoyltransferase ZDHHC9/14/18